MANALDLTTIANVKSWLQIKSNEFDDDLTRLITASSVFAQSWMNRNIITSAYVEKRSGHGGQNMMTSNYPLVTVDSVTVDGLVIPAISYTFDAHEIFLVNGYFTRAKNNVALGYTAGYATVPADIEQGIIETIALRWKERDRIGLTSKAMAGETTSFITSDYPPSAIGVFKQYKKVIPLT
jgi:hypothetical protein